MYSHVPPSPRSSIVLLGGGEEHAGTPSCRSKTHLNRKESWQDKSYGHLNASCGSIFESQYINQEQECAVATRRGANSITERRRSLELSSFLDSPTRIKKNGIPASLKTFLEASPSATTPVSTPGRRKVRIKFADRMKAFEHGNISNATSSSRRTIVGAPPLISPRTPTKGSISKLGSNSDPKNLKLAHHLSPTTPPSRPKLAAHLATQSSQSSQKMPPPLRSSIGKSLVTSTQLPGPLPLESAASSPRYSPHKRYVAKIDTSEVFRPKVYSKAKESNFLDDARLTSSRVMQRKRVKASMCVQAAWRGKVARTAYVQRWREQTNRDRQLKAAVFMQACFRGWRQQCQYRIQVLEQRLAQSHVYKAQQLREVAQQTMKKKQQLKSKTTVAPIPMPSISSQKLQHTTRMLESSRLEKLRLVTTRQELQQECSDMTDTNETLQHGLTTTVTDMAGLHRQMAVLQEQTLAWQHVAADYRTKLAKLQGLHDRQANLGYLEGKHVTRMQATMQRMLDALLERGGAEDDDGELIALVRRSILVDG